MFRLHVQMAPNFHAKFYSGNKCQMNVATFFCSRGENVNGLLDELLKVITDTTACLKCLKDGKACDFDDIRDGCSNCSASNEICTSLIAYNVTSDMNSTQVKLSLDDPHVVQTAEELFDRLMHLYTFGLLHCTKAVPRYSRNWNLTFNGHHHNIKVLLSLWNSPCQIGDDLKLALTSKQILGKDKQNDEDSYALSSRQVQEALKNVNYYLYQLLPDKNFIYTDSSLSHKKVKSISTVSPCSAKEERIFLVDPLGRSVWVLNNMTVPKVMSIHSPSFGSLRDLSYLHIPDNKIPDVALVTDTSKRFLFIIQYDKPIPTEEEEEDIDGGESKKSKKKAYQIKGMEFLFDSPPLLVDTRARDRVYSEVVVMSVSLAVSVLELLHSSMALQKKRVVALTTSRGFESNHPQSVHFTDDGHILCIMKDGLWRIGEGRALIRLFIFDFSPIYRPVINQFTVGIVTSRGRGGR